ncbi:hypothetical protein SDC9_53958 [bioreactor metagenome]|uniref:Secretion system C-terminal sorting domain-containing protein n=1 Tax=bioreactor metagenome TaxID=1076179 RepID=A0A644WVM3_9ZZZZ
MNSNIFNFQLSTQKFMFMKKLTLLTLACSLTLLSFAAGGNITYVLNGGVTNDYGWKNKTDMLVSFSADYNTVSGKATNWGAATTAGQIQAATFNVMYEVFAHETVGPKWTWLKNYVIKVATDTKHASLTSLQSGNNTYWRGAIDGFFTNSQFAKGAWNECPDFTTAGLPESFIPTWEHAFAGPATYDGLTEIILPSPYKVGFTFDGWYDNESFSGNKVTSIAVGAEGDKTLYAKWIEYIPTCLEIKSMTNGTSTKAGGTITYVNGTTVYIQDASAGLLVEFTEAQTVVAGDKINILGTVTDLGTYKKITNATLSSKEAATVPAHQTIALTTLKGDPGTYMFEYINLEGLKIVSYGTGSVVLADDAENTITLIADLNQTSLPVNTKVNVKAIVTFDTELKIIAEASKVTASPVPRPDGQTYAALQEGKYTLTSKWLVSNVLDNLSANPIGTNGFVRGMTAKDGKMYFIDREHKQITVVDGETGNKLAPITLASNLFQHVGKDKDGNDSIYLAGTLQYNDIKQDNAGNILISNLTTSIAQPFQVWKIDLATGNGTLIVDEILKDNVDFANATVRFDAFGVTGDINSNAIIMAANASALEAYKWDITNGVAGPAEAILIDNSIDGTFLKGLTNPGTAPQIFPMDENYFYLDGNATLPTLIDMSGEIVDGFYNVPKEVEDWSVSISSKQGHNGLIEFEMGGEHFFLMAYMNTAGSPASSFRLFKWANANKEFKDIQSLWILPANGMGAASNAYRTAVPSVEVDEVNKVATIYLYTGENGYGVYEFKINEGSDVKNVNDNSIVKINVNEKTLNFDKQVANVTVYSIAGQLEVKAKNVNAVNVANKGIYLVKATTHEGETVVHKVIVK